MEYITHSPAETEELGCRLGRTLGPGAVVAYFGGLGMGPGPWLPGPGHQPHLHHRQRIRRPHAPVPLRYVPPGGR